MHGLTNSLRNGLGAIFPQKNASLRFQTSQHKGQKIQDSSRARTFQLDNRPVRKGQSAGTVCDWHVWILLHIPVARILWDFGFLRGLALGRLDRFSIGRYEKNPESFDLYAVKFESGVMRFLGEKSLQR